jgi:hypothetical protein
MEFDNIKRAIKVIYDHSDLESSNNECHKQLHIMYVGSWDITSRRIIKTLCQMVAAAASAPRAVPHHKWMETSIALDAFYCPKNMVGAEQLLLIVSTTISNVRLYHTPSEGGGGGSTQPH